MKKSLSLVVLDDTLAICRLSPSDPFPAWASKSRFYSITRSADEISVVCAESDVPDGVKSEKAWNAFKVQGPLDFALTGILASLSTTLADGGVSLFALSTFDTDYVLVKGEALEKAKALLRAAGNQITNECRA